MRGRNYSLCCTFGEDATILSELSATLTLGSLQVCPSSALNWQQAPSGASNLPQRDFWPAPDLAGG
jgi:hypothetical protein